VNDAEYIEEFGRRFPSLKKVLIDDRNRHMADGIRKIAEGSMDVVAVIGDGHIEGIRTLIADLQVKVIRLKELRGMQKSTATSGDTGGQSGNGQVSFSFEYR
jgi:pheromone shutdown protein TraB